MARNPLSLWRLSRFYSVHQAALLLLDHDPQLFENYSEYNIKAEAPGYLAVKTALIREIEHGSFGDTNREYNYISGANPELNIHETYISKDDLNEFAKNHKINCAIFQQEKPQTIEYDNFFSPYYSNRLDAANKAWIAVTRDPSLFRGNSPKRALQKWLEDHAAEFDLLNRDGKPSRKAIEEISKVANWKKEGGAPATASRAVTSPLNPASPLPSPAPPSDPPASGEDDDFPF